MKRCYLYIILCLLGWSCRNEWTENEFTVLSEMIDDSKSKHKPVLLYLYAENCDVCELAGYRLFQDEEVKSYIHQHFLFYKANIAENPLFSRLLFFYGAPVFLVVEGEEVKSLIAHSESKERFLYGLVNYKMIPLEANIPSYTNLKGRESRISRSVNDLLKVLYHQEKRDWSEEQISSLLESSVKDYPRFYNQYLLQQSYKPADKMRADSIRDFLTDQYQEGLVTVLFPTEVQQLLEERYGLQKDAKAEISFEHVKYDFGKLKPNEVVSHKFPFKNTSAVPLLIYSVNTSCGCTVPRWDRKPILSGEVDSLEVIFTASSSGNNSKTIHVITNAAKRNTLLTVNAVVE